MPAAAQTYLADNGSNVTVDYSVIGLGSGPGPVTRGALPGSALPAGSLQLRQRADGRDRRARRARPSPIRSAPR